MAVRRKLTQADWDVLRPQIVHNYTKESHTVRRIVEDLNRRGLIVSKKMIWDRFTIWHVPRKYKSQHIGTGRPSSALLVNPQRPVSSSSDDHCFHNAMTTVGQWLESIVVNGSWKQHACVRRIDMQRLVSRAHMAIESHSFDTNARQHELESVAYQVRDSMFAMVDASMHPRVLTALMRWWISDWQTTGFKQEMLAAVKKMVCTTSREVLNSGHPIATLSKLASSRNPPDEVVVAFFSQWRKKFLDKIVEEDPDFAVREQIYGARVLASIGRPAKAVELLDKTDLRREVIGNTRAEFHSTRGYAQMQNGHYQKAIGSLNEAVETFKANNEENCEGAEYAHFCLSTCHDKISDPVGQEHHLKAALRAWECNAALQNGQGGIKIVRDLHRVYEKHGKTAEMQELEWKYPEYFVEVQAQPG